MTDEIDADDERLRLIALTLAHAEGREPDDEIPDRIWNRARKILANAGHQKGVGFQSAPTDPIEIALLEWFPKADIWRDGKLAFKGVNLLGSNQPIEHKFAQSITEHIRIYGADREGLTAMLRNVEGIAKYVRSWSAAEWIADSIIRMLERKDLLP